MARFSTDDCRNGSMLGKTVSKYPVFYEHRERGLMIAPAGKTRAEKRASKHFAGRKNTRGVPLGFSHKTWADYCISRAEVKETQ